MVRLHDHLADPLELGLRFAGRPKGEVFYGVELEVETPTADDATWLTTNRAPYMQRAVSALGTDFVICKHDGSLAGHGTRGFEIVTAPGSLLVHRKRWEKFFSGDLSGISVSTRCGMHVHVSRQPLTQVQIGRMVVFVNEPMHSGFIERVAGRTSERYAKRIKKSLADVWSMDRYEAVNVTKRATVELRIFAATLEKQRFLANLEFTVALTEWASDDTRKMSVEDFRAWVGQSKRYENFNAWLTSQ